MKLVAGNIFDAPQAYALVVPVNTAGVPGAGLAMKAAQKYPLWRYAYQAAVRNGLLSKGGDVVFHHLPHNPRKMMVSFATKGKNYRKPSQLDWIVTGLESVALELLKSGAPLAIPALGCGLGGLDFWLDVYPLIESKMAGFDILVYQPVSVRPSIPGQSEVLYG